MFLKLLPSGRMLLNVTHLHQTSHKSPNIKWQKIAFYLKMSETCYFLFSSKQLFLGKTLSKYLYFLLFCWIFQVFLAMLKVNLKDVEIWFFFFNGHFAFKIYRPCTDADTITVITPCTMQKVGKAPSRTDLIN